MDIIDLKGRKNANDDKKKEGEKRRELVVLEDCMPPPRPSRVISTRNGVLKS